MRVASARYSHVRGILHFAGYLLLFAVVLLLTPRSGYSVDKTILIDWETWWFQGAEAEPGTTLKLKDKALTDLRSGTANLNGDVETGADVIQLGYFGDASTLAPTATKNNPFLGTFIPLTLVTTIGDSVDNSGFPDGEFAFNTDFTENSDTASHYTSFAGAYTETVTDLSTKLAALETAIGTFPAPAGDQAGGYLAIRFFDVNNGPTSTEGGFSGITNDETTTMYNTVTDVEGLTTASPRWLWTAMADSGSPYNHVSLYDDDSDPATVRTDLLWEFDNSVYDGDTYVDANDILATPTASTFEPGATTITWIGVDSADNNVNPTLATDDFTNDVDIVVSNLNLTLGAPSIDAGAKTLSLIINTASGHETDFSAGSLAGDDLGLIKVGLGEQTLSIATETGGPITIKAGELILAKSDGGTGTIFTDDTIRDIDSYVRILDDPALNSALQIGGTAHTEWARFLTGDVATARLNFKESVDGNELQLGLDGTEDLDGNAGTVENFQTFAGTVNLPSDGNKATINVTEVTGWQKVGALAGDGDFEKKGSGILEITGASGSLTGNAEIILDGGTLVVGNDNSLGGQGIATNNFKQGKLSIGSGATDFDDTVNTTGATAGAKTMIGGTGTYSNAITIGPSTGAHTFHELDPGLAASVSLSAQASGYQVVQNPGNTIGEFTTAGLTWDTGGIFNWEIKNFDDSNQGLAGTNWDLFNFTGGTPLNMAITGRKIRILGITPTAYTGGAIDPRHGTADGAMGIPTNWDYTAREFKFMTGTFSNASEGQTFDSTYFDIDDEQFSWLTQDWNGVWQVKYSSNALYLTYQAVPEPSTYVMVVGALFLPIWSFFRRRRSRRKEEE